MELLGFHPGRKDNAMNEIVNGRKVLNEAQSHALQLAVKAVDEALQGDVLDRFSKYFPGWNASRLRAKQEVGYRRAMLAYAAAQFPGNNLQRQTAYESLTSEEAYFPGYSRFQMITDSRDLYRNFPIIRAGVDGIARRAISTGIHPQFHTSDTTWNEETKEQWDDWSRSCEITRRFTLCGCARQSIRSCYVDGDLGVKLIAPEEDSDLELQLIEGDLIAENMRTGVNLDTINPLGGVILDKKTGRVTGYMVGRRGIGGILQDCHPVGAEEMLLLFRQQRVDQVRGVPLLAPVIQTARDLERYINATRMQANIAATFGVVIKKHGAALFGQQMSQQAQNLPTDAFPGQSTNQNYRTVPLKTGQMWFLNPDEDVGMFNPSSIPGPQFDQFAKFLVRMIAIGMGITYEYLMQDFSGMSFSSSRTNLMDMTLTLRLWQRWLVESFFSKVYFVWVAKRLQNGVLDWPENPLEAYTKVSWQLPEELGVDPKKDSAADVQLLSAGLDTFSNQYQQRGQNWKEQIAQKADEVAFIEQLAREKGIRPELISMTLPPGTIKPGEAAGSSESKNPEMAVVPGSEGHAGGRPVEKL
jgi:lambda family phage portal protein